MAIRAVHEAWGTVFSHLPDLGCARSWEEIWRARPLPPLRCDECRHPMYAKVSSTGLRFFAHAPGAPHCTLAEESLAHHLLKLTLAGAARDAGALAELEVPAPGGAWRADVLASSPDRAWRVALEAQLSPITGDDIKARTERMRGDGVRVCWFTDRRRSPWLGLVPSVRLADAQDGDGLGVVEGLARYEADRWLPAGDVSLAEFLRGVFDGTLVVHEPGSAAAVGVTGPLVWTAPRSITAERDQHHRKRLEAEAAAEQKKTDDARRARQRSREAELSKRALADAAAAERAARETAGAAAVQRRQRYERQHGVPAAVKLLADDHNLTATVGWSCGAPRYAGGVPLVDEAGNLVAVFDPVPRLVRAEPFVLLTQARLIFLTSYRRRQFLKAAAKTGHQPVDGYATDVTWNRSRSDETPIVPSSGRCTCTAPQLVAVICGSDYPAEPSDTMGPAAALYIAQCRACGCQYDKPWRRTVAARAGRSPA